MLHFEVESATGNSRFEGTDIEAGGRADIAAGGDVNFDTARDTSSGNNVGLNVIDATGNTLGRNKNRVDVEAGFTDGSTARTGGIRAGEGIGVSAGGTTDISGDIERKDAPVDIDLRGGIDLR